MSFDAEKWGLLEARLPERDNQPRNQRLAVDLNSTTRCFVLKVSFESHTTVGLFASLKVDFWVCKSLLDSISLQRMRQLLRSLLRGKKKKALTLQL